MSDRNHRDEHRRNARRIKERALDAQMEGRFQQAERLRDAAYDYKARARDTSATRRFYR